MARLKGSKNKKKGTALKKFVCPVCGKEKYVYGKRMYCSVKCKGIIQSEKYKNILNKISRTDTISLSFKRQEIITKLNSEEVKVFDNFIRKMENLNVIIKDKEHGRGAYRFSSELYFLFFLIQAVHKEQ